MSQLNTTVLKFLDEPIAHTEPLPDKERMRAKTFARNLAAGVVNGYIGEEIFFSHRQAGRTAFTVNSVMNVPESYDYINRLREKWDNELCPDAHLMIDQGFLHPDGKSFVGGGKFVLTKAACILPKSFMPRKVLEFFHEVRAQSMFMKFLLALALKDIYEIVSSII